MTQVTVHRCVLRIRRTAGWSWGPSSDALLDAAARALPALVASRLPALAAAEARPVHVISPVRIRVETTLAELAALAGRTSAGAVAGAVSASALEHRIGAAIEAALAARQGGALTEPPPVREVSQRDVVPGVPEHGDAVRSPLAALRVLRAWATRGVIDRVLAGLLPTALVALHDLVLAAPDPPVLTAPASFAPPSVSSPELALAASGHLTGATASAALAALRARLSLAATILGRDVTVSPGQLCAMVDASVPAPPRAVVHAAISPAALGLPASLEAPATSLRSASGLAPMTAPLRGMASLATDPDAASRTPSAAALMTAPPRAALAPPEAASRFSAARSEPFTPRVAEIEVRSALPFLILPALHHAGWLDTVAVLLDAHGLAADSVALAAALAGKLLDPPERGWMRSPADRAIIAAFAGQGEPIPDDQLVAAASRLAPVLDVLDDSLRAVLRDVRRPDAPIVLWRGASGWSALDSDGFAVLANAPALVPVLASVAALGEPLVVVPAGCADPATLDRVDLTNLRFVTDARPTRGEPWRALAGHDRPLWTNDTATPAGKLAAVVAGFASLDALAGELTSELEVRPALARTPLPALETTATLAVTAALADMSARLFPDEPTTPILALSRFRDLDARVRFEPDCIRVRVPLGRRHADLMHHGLLTTIARVPWLGGRCVDLGGA